MNEFNQAFQQHCIRLNGIKKFYNMRLAGMVNEHRREKQKNLNKMNQIRNSDRNELLKELELEKGDEYRNLVDYQTGDKCCQTEGNFQNLTISLQFNKPKKTMYSKGQQANPISTSDKIMQVNFVRQEEKKRENSKCQPELEKSLSTPRNHFHSRGPSEMFDPFRDQTQGKTPAGYEDILEIIDDDEGSDQFEDMLNMSTDNLDKSPPNETSSIQGRGGANPDSLSVKNNPKALLVVPRTPTNQPAGGGGSRRQLSRQPSIISMASNQTNRLVKLPSGVFDEKPNLMGRKSISLRGLKEIAQYFDDALQMKAVDDLNKDKEHLKTVLKKLDDFIEYNKKNLSHLNKTSLESKKKILESVESQMIEFSEIQTKYYQVIFEKENLKRNANPDALSMEAPNPAILPEAVAKIELDVLKKINSKNNMMISEANNILKKILVKNVNNEINKDNTFSSKGTNLLNIISRVYKDYIAKSVKAKKEGRGFPSTPLPIYFYKFLAMKISNNNLVQKKFEVILSSIIANDTTSAINLFGKFLGITGNYDHRCLEIFIETLQHFQKVA